MTTLTIYWVSDGKLKPKPFTNIDYAVEYADQISGIVLVIDKNSPLGFNIVYSYGERKAMGVV